MKTLKCPACGFIGTFQYGETVYKSGDLVITQDGFIGFDESPEEFKSEIIVICPDCEIELETPYEQYIIDQTTEEK